MKTTEDTHEPAQSIGAYPHPESKMLNFQHKACNHHHLRRRRRRHHRHHGSHRHPRRHRKIEAEDHLVSDFDCDHVLQNPSAQSIKTSEGYCARERKQLDLCSCKSAPISSTTCCKSLQNSCRRVYKIYFPVLNAITYS